MANDETYSDQQREEVLSRLQRFQDEQKVINDQIRILKDKALASLPGIIGGMFSWILNRPKEVIGWLSQNLWALITGVGVLIYTYFMTKTNRR